MDKEVLTKLSDSADTSTARAIAIKLALNANANVGSVKWKGAKDKPRQLKSIVRELETYLAASTDNVILTDLSIEKCDDAAIIDVLGDTLGSQALELVAIRQAERAKTANITSERTNGASNDAADSDPA